MKKTSEEIRQGYRDRLILPELPDEDEEIEEIIFYTKSGLEVARWYERVVIGDRGPYIEFQGEMLTKENFAPNAAKFVYELRKVQDAQLRMDG